MAFDIPVLPNCKELLRALRSIDIAVPPRGDGRDQRTHVEPYVICHLLAALASAKKLDYPVSLKRRDRPDFELTLGNCCIGVEVIEAIEKDYGHYAAKANDIESKEIILLEPGHFRNGRNRTRKKIEALLAQYRPTRPFYGNEPEREWASHVAHRITLKQQKLAQYENFGANWLVLYDNLHFPKVNLRTAVGLLGALLPKRHASPAFDAVFIESDASIIKLTPDSLEWIASSDLWKAAILETTKYR